MLVAGSVIVAVTRPVMDLRKAGPSFGFEPGMLEGLLVVLLLAAWLWGWYRAARHFRSLPAVVQRHPLLCLHGGFWLLLVVLWTTQPAQPLVRGVLIGCAVALPFLLWRLGYLLLAAQRGRLAGTSLRDHLIYLWPAWGGTDTPYGKGHDYLKSVEARDAEALARSQLAGLKLFVLALACAVGKDLIEGLVFGEDNGIRRALGGITLGIPTLDARLLAPRGTHPLWTGWSRCTASSFRLVLRMGANGHVIVGCLRLFGFNVFRNTYKPLLAETIVEFWNRYYFYFKELLVNTFFLPTFTRWFRRARGSGCSPRCSRRRSSVTCIIMFSSRTAGARRLDGTGGNVQPAPDLLFPARGRNLPVDAAPAAAARATALRSRPRQRCRDPRCLDLLLRDPRLAPRRGLLRRPRGFATGLIGVG